MKKPPEPCAPAASCVLRFRRYGQWNVGAPGVPSVVATRGSFSGPPSVSTQRTPFEHGQTESVFRFIIGDFFAASSRVSSPAATRRIWSR